MTKRLKNALWNSYLSMATRLFRNTSLFLVLGMGLFGSEVYGLCNQDPLDGAWKNIDPSNNGRLEFNQICNDTPYCDETGCHHPPPTVGALRVLVACTPFPCDWGWTQGDRILIPCNDVDRRLESDLITGS